MNLVDYYLIRFGDYDVPSFFAADGGVYGHYNMTALICYLVGIAAQVPFVAADFYTGPLARAIGGVDLSWVAGIAVVSPVYYFAVRFLQRPRERAASRELVVRNPCVDRQSRQSRCGVPNKGRRPPFKAQD